MKCMWSLIFCRTHMKKNHFLLVIMHTSIDKENKSTQRHAVLWWKNQTLRIHEFLRICHRSQSSGQGGCGDIGNNNNNTIDYSESTKKDYRGVIEAFGAVLALKYEKVYFKKPFDVFKEKLIKYTIKELNNAKDVLVLVQHMEDPKASFYTKNEPIYLNKAGAKSEVKKYILNSIIRQYIEREVRLVSNTQKMYGIIWGQCNSGLRSVLKENLNFPFN